MFYRIQPGLQRSAIPQRMMQPVGEQSAAHVGGTGVEQREQGGCGFTAQGLGDLQIASRGGIHAHVAVRAVHLHAADVADGLALGEFGVTEQCACGFQSHGEIVAAESGEVESGELLAQARGVLFPTQNAIRVMP